MGLTLTLTDKDIPASPSFIEFLHSTITGTPYHAGEWFFQEGESLAQNPDRYKDIMKKATVVTAHPLGKKALTHAYRLFKEILIGMPNILKQTEKFHFFFIVGIPRTGGTYLTKQLYRAAGIDYKSVQNALAHDGFPHIEPLSFKKERGNMHTAGLLQLAEYMVMVEIFYSRNPKFIYKNRILVPKKFTKGMYNFPLIDVVFPNNATYLITLRHPLAMIHSVLEKSGGMPKGGKFKVRSAIERWGQNELIGSGTSEADIAKMDYMDVMLEYWKRFHLQMGMSGMVNKPSARLVPYGKEYMVKEAENLFREMGVTLKPEAFKSADKPDFSASVNKKAQKAMEDVANLWESLGATFPIKELAKQY
ncbi:MAG: hypothetical protein EB060_05635 [Proteobacteria bacterium]|nr:hypothetical protein [Pseudomonadota bacterium]